jgi:hypothetical protein
LEPLSDCHRIQQWQFHVVDVVKEELDDIEEIGYAVKVEENDEIDDESTFVQEVHGRGDMASYTMQAEV